MHVGIVLMAIAATRRKTSSPGWKQNRRPLGRLFLHSGNVDVQSQFLNFQDLSFHGVNVSSRHASNRWDR
jgi:hypothetical protein